MEKMEEKPERASEIIREILKDRRIVSLKGWEIQCRPAALLLALSLFGMGLFMPSLFNAVNGDVFNLLAKALYLQDIGILLESAIFLTFINSLRSLPNYLCVLAVSMSYAISFRGKRNMILEAIALTVSAFILIRIGYSLIYCIYAIEYGWGVHAISIVVFIMYLHIRNTESCKKGQLFLFMLLFIIGIQFLDIIPILTRFGMGKGELSAYIKLAAILLGGEHVITIFASTASCVFLFNAFIIIRLVLDENRLRLAMKKERELEKHVYESHMQAVEIRSLREIQSLVHDLKAPLTTICGLSNLTTMMTRDNRISEYQERISCSAEKMSKMISEVLNKDYRMDVTVRELIEQMLAYLPDDGTKNILRVEDDCPAEKINVNRVRMVRAFVNLLQNARTAVGTNENGYILFRSFVSGEWIEFDIWDNGRGIEEKELRRIWDLGYSQSQSTGVGLSFVHSVVMDHDGSIRIDSLKEQYTNVTVRIRRASSGI